MNFASSPAFRPSHPHGCRKRSSGQGHALSGRFAGLDRMPLLSGYGRLRATDEEASGGGSVKGSPLFQYKKAFSASRNFPAYRQAADTMHIRPPRLALRRVLPIHAL